ncbi:MAG: class I SAM-dependent methyltransferase [Pseudomonadota bacterium]
MADRQSWDARYQAKPLVWSAGPNALFAELADTLSPGRALDLACGEGRNALHLAAHGWTVTGVDFSGVAIQKAGQIAAQRELEPTLIVADVVEYDPGEAKFDLVTIIFLHTSSAEREIWLPMAARALAPGGVLLYIGHDPRNISEGVGGPQDPDVLPGVDALVRALPGFDMLRAEVVTRSVAADPGHGGSSAGNALDTLVMARRKPGAQAL